jgi:hypothetical protein
MLTYNNDRTLNDRTLNNHLKRSMVVKVGTMFRRIFTPRYGLRRFSTNSSNTFNKNLANVPKPTYWSKLKDPSTGESFFLGAIAGLAITTYNYDTTVISDHMFVNVGLFSITSVCLMVMGGHISRCVVAHPTVASLFIVPIPFFLLKRGYDKYKQKQY